MLLLLQLICICIQIRFCICTALYVVLQSTTHSMLHTHTVCFIHRQSPNAQFVSAIMLGSLTGALPPNHPLSPIHFTSARQICFEGHGSICICICAAAQCNHPLSPIHLIPARHLCLKEHRTSLNVTTIRKLTNCWPEASKRLKIKISSILKSAKPCCVQCTAVYYS